MVPALGAGLHHDDERDRARSTHRPHLFHDAPSADDAPSGRAHPQDHPQDHPLGNSAGKLEEEVPDVPGQQLAASEEYGPSSQAALGRRELAHLDELLAVAQEDFLAPLGATERQAPTDLLTRLVDHHRAERG